MGKSTLIFILFTSVVIASLVSEISAAGQDGEGPSRPDKLPIRSQTKKLRARRRDRAEAMDFPADSPSIDFVPAQDNVPAHLAMTIPYVPQIDESNPANAELNAPPHQMSEGSRRSTGTLRPYKKREGRAEDMKFPDNAPRLVLVPGTRSYQMTLDPQTGFNVGARSSDIIEVDSEDTVTPPDSDTEGENLEPIQHEIDRYRDSYYFPSAATGSDPTKPGSYYASGSHPTGSLNTNYPSELPAARSFNPEPYDSSSYHPGSYASGSGNLEPYDPSSYHPGSYDPSSYHPRSYASGSVNPGPYYSDPYNQNPYDASSYPSDLHHPGSYQPDDPHNQGIYHPNDQGSYDPNEPDTSLRLGPPEDTSLRLGSPDDTSLRLGPPDDTSLRLGPPGYHK